MFNSLRGDGYEKSEPRLVFLGIPNVYFFSSMSLITASSWDSSKGLVI